MIVAHLSDLHLGFRAYGRIERDANMRERDVAAAFDRAVQEVVRLSPDVIVVSGDVFDRPDPPASAVVALARGLETLGGRLPEVPVLMAAGPRDTPRRSGDPGALAVLDSFPNVEAATGLTRSILIERLGLHACLVPYRAVRRQPPAPPDPDPRMRWNVLVLHAEAVQSSAGGLHLDPQEWDYDVSRYHDAVYSGPGFFEITPRASSGFTVVGSGVPAGMTYPTGSCNRLIVVSGSQQGWHVFAADSGAIASDVASGRLTLSGSF